ncbi:hypothetical protein N9B10_04725 [Pirellulales bacterium]|nr:hypothetical protein [Pirellulales bacterium]
MWEEAQRDHDEWYAQQLANKRYLQARNHAYDKALKVPSWYVDIYKDSPQLQGDFLITSGGHVIGKHKGSTAEGT